MSENKMNRRKIFIAIFNFNLKQTKRSKESVIN